MLQDGDSPLTYEVSYSVDPTAPNDLVYSGLSSGVSFHLPAGRAENNHSGKLPSSGRVRAENNHLGKLPPSGRAR